MSIIFALRLRRLLKKGCTGYLVSLSGEEKVIPKLEEIPVMCEYPGMLPEDLLGLPRV